MALLTSQQISRYYDKFQDTDVVFTKDVIRSIGMITKNVYLKQGGRQIPCVVYSTSMKGARVIANVKSETFGGLAAGKASLSLRFSFQQPDKTDPLSFYVACKVAGFSPYGQSNRELNFVSLVYPHRPSDDLISILGQLLETNANSKRRREERIVLTVDKIPKLGLKSKDAVVYIQNVPRKCIVRDLSFGGSLLIIPGMAKFLLHRSVVLHLEFEDAEEALKIAGSIIRIEPVADRDDIAAIAIAFDEEDLPLAYKMRISDFLSTTTQTSRTAAAGE